MAKQVPNKNSVRGMAMGSGMSMQKFAEANIHADSPIGKKARLAYLMSNVHGTGKSTMAKVGDGRTAAQKLYQIG
jgi:hypothetical protein